MSTKQIIVVRKDLNMRKGKIAAQAAHASLAIFTRNMESIQTQHGYARFTVCISDTHALVVKEWLESSFAKVCVYVNSEQELEDVYNKAKEKGLLCDMIVDSGKTEFNGVPTKTCCSIGPARNEDLIGITDHLPLY